MEFNFFADFYKDYFSLASENFMKDDEFVKWYKTCVTSAPINVYNVSDLTDMISDSFYLDETLNDLKYKLEYGTSELLLSKICFLNNYYRGLNYQYVSKEAYNNPDIKLVDKFYLNCKLIYDNNCLSTNITLDGKIIDKAGYGIKKIKFPIDLVSYIEELTDDVKLEIDFYKRHIVLIKLKYLLRLNQEDCVLLKWVLTSAFFSYLKKYGFLNINIIFENLKKLYPYLSFEIIEYFFRDIKVNYPELLKSNKVKVM